MSTSPSADPSFAASTYFQRLLQRWNITPDRVIDRVDTRDAWAQGATLGDFAESQNKLHRLTITDVQQMKRLAGIADRSFDEQPQLGTELTYPSAMPSRLVSLFASTPNRSDLRHHLTTEESHLVRHAWQTYLAGDSRKVPTPLVDLINAVHFPLVADVITVDSLVVDAAEPLVIGRRDGPPQIIIFRTLLIRSDAMVRFQGPSTFQGGSSTSESDQHVFLIHNGAAPTPPPAPAIMPAPLAAPGRDGLTGATGNPGANGSHGTAPPAVNITIQNLIGSHRVLVGGGDGANGGEGGPGGQGGDGGIGNLMPPNRPGRGGRGGTGGTGGLPGNGASGSVSTFTTFQRSGLFSINVERIEGKGGQPGAGGIGGLPGAGGLDIGRTMGAAYVPRAYQLGHGDHGVTGNGGIPGKNGRPGVMIVQTANEL